MEQVELQEILDLMHPTTHASITKWSKTAGVSDLVLFENQDPREGVPGTGARSVVPVGPGMHVKKVGDCEGTHLGTPATGLQVSTKFCVIARKSEPKKEVPKESKEEK